MNVINLLNGLEWEREWDCIKKMREWIIENVLATDEELSEIEAISKRICTGKQAKAWEKYLAPIKKQVAKAVESGQSTLQIESPRTSFTTSESYQQNF